MRPTVFLALSAALMPLATQAIINGRFATDPFLKGVVKVNDDCTGALVGNKCVLTAHHCLTKNRRGEIMIPEYRDSVVFESSKKSTIVSTLEPGYSNEHCYDMEIAVLSENHNMGYNLTKGSVNNKSVAVAGWGFLHDYTIPKQLQFVQYTAKAKHLPSGIKIPVADGVSGIAFRDSGGPLFSCIGTNCYVVAVANGRSVGSTLLETEHEFCDVHSNWDWVTETLSAHCY